MSAARHADKLAAEQEAARKEAEAHRDCGPIGVGCVIPSISIDPGAIVSGVVSVGVAIATDPVGFINENGSLIAHTTLGVAAMLSIPLISSAAALADAGLYVSEGNYTEAGLALLGAIPGGAALKYGGLALGAVGGGVLLAKGYKTFRAGKGLTKLEDAGGLTARLEKIGVSYVDDGAKALKSCATGHSFSADTAVATAGGETPIGSVEVGDSVLAYDPTTGETATHTVTAVMVHTDPVVEHLSTDQGSIETTPNHRFFSAERGWVEAGSLRAGERIRTANGTDALVIGFTLEATPSDMYDLTVESAHSFFVGSGGLLVHNCGGADLGRKLDYFTGQATGTTHNVRRSQDMASQLSQIGIGNTRGGRRILRDHLESVYADATSIVATKGARTTRESLLAGPGGFRKLQTVWEDNKLITGLIYGG
jgi:hypothetical protein